MKLEDVGSYHYFPAKEREKGVGEWEMPCGEGLRVGYRNDLAPEPRYPFGYGLSYTTFSVIQLSCKIIGTGKEGHIDISVNVHSTGGMAGAEIVQVYVRDLESSVWRPKEELKAF